MQIKKIKKVASNKYKIDFTNGDSIIAYDNVILENNILLKKEIDDSLYEEMLAQNDYYSIYSKIIKYITVKLRSEAEIKKYISKYSCSQSISERLIKRLKCEGLINDSRYIKAFIEDKVNLTNDGPIKIKNDLINMGMNEEEVSQVLSNYNDDIFYDKAISLAQKKVKLNHKDSSYILKQKIENFLFNLGYEQSMIKDVSASVNISDNVILEREIEKLYQKLKFKYNEEDLLNVIKQKLYKKGFSISDIKEELIKYQK